MNTTRLKHLIEIGINFNNGKKNNNAELSEWTYEVEEFLGNEGKLSHEVRRYLKGIRTHGNSSFFRHLTNTIAFLKHMDNTVEPPPMKKQNQIFVAMWFSDEMKKIYRQGYDPTITGLGYKPIRIDLKEYNGSVINKICEEINDSVAIIADLTNNRGGVYYEAGIARGLKICGHPIELILTCKNDYFYAEERTKNPHFDVSGDNIIIYKDNKELKSKLKARIVETVN